MSVCTMWVNEDRRCEMVPKEGRENRDHGTAQVARKRESSGRVRDSEKSSRRVRNFSGISVSDSCGGVRRIR